MFDKLNVTIRLKPIENIIPQTVYNVDNRVALGHITSKVESKIPMKPNTIILIIVFVIQFIYKFLHLLP